MNSQDLRLKPTMIPDVLNTIAPNSNNCLALVRLLWQGEIACVEFKLESAKDGESQAAALDFKRGDRVVVEVGHGQQVASFVSWSRVMAAPTGRLWGKMKPEDELRFGYLEQFAIQALEKYNARLTDEEQEYQLLGVEPLLDGATLNMQFLHSGVPQHYCSMVLELFGQEAESSEFSKKVANGCGPNCGQERSSGSCSTCKNCKTCSVLKSR